MKYKIEKNTVQETLILPLYSRKLCTELYPNLYRDETAVRLLDQIDYDFSEAEKNSRSLMLQCTRFIVLEGHFFLRNDKSMRRSVLQMKLFWGKIAGDHQMPRNVKVNSTGLVTSGIYSGWTLAPQLSSPPTPICSPIARMTV